jgi:ribonuclease BN (tRNA processing enzyme)
MPRIRSALDAPPRWDPPGLGVLQGSAGYCIGLQSVWLFVRALGVQFDAGDGVATALGRHVGAPHTIALSHAHGDHLHGLVAELGMRQARSLVQGGPVRVLYPARALEIGAVRGLLDACWPHGMDRVRWQPMEAGASVEVGPRRRLVAFDVQHSPHMHCLGYAVVEQRRRRAAGALPGPDGRVASEPYEHVVFAHTGDALADYPPLLRGASVLVADATFLEAADREAPTHATVGEVLAAAMDLDIRTLVLHHLSIRYERATLQARIAQMAAAAGYTGDLWLWDGPALARVGGAQG